MTDWKRVSDRSFERFDKFGGAPSVLVRYTCAGEASDQGPSLFKEWVPVENDRMRRLAERWWRHHGGESPAPATVEDFLGRVAELRDVDEIRVEPDGKFWRITGRRIAGAGSGNLDFVHGATG